jgi:hypothetical protein
MQHGFVWRVMSRTSHSQEMRRLPRGSRMPLPIDGVTRLEDPAERVRELQLAAATRPVRELRRLQQESASAS